jgi:hypothetical protein
MRVLLVLGLLIVLAAGVLILVPEDVPGEQVRSPVPATLDGVIAPPSFAPVERVEVSGAVDVPVAPDAAVTANDESVRATGSRES